MLWLAWDVYFCVHGLFPVVSRRLAGMGELSGR